MPLPCACNASQFHSALATLPGAVQAYFDDDRGGEPTHNPPAFWWDVEGVAESFGHSASVHCLAGRSRSVSILCAHLMKKIIQAEAHQASLDPSTPVQVLKVPLTVAVLDFMRERRMCIQPNESFYRQLLDWEQRLRDRVIQEKEHKLDLPNDV